MKWVKNNYLSWHFPGAIFWIAPGKYKTYKGDGKDSLTPPSL